MKKVFLIFSVIIFLLSSARIMAQPLKVYGIVTNALNEPLPYASIQIKEEQLGKTTNTKGYFEFTLKEGKYDVVVSMLGYKTQVVTIILDRINLEQNIQLESSNNTQLKSIQISSVKKDRATEIMKQLIQHKDSLAYPNYNYSCNLYIKAWQELEAKQEKNNTKIDSLKIKNGNKFNGNSLAEIAIVLDYAYPNKMKETRTGVKKYGDVSNLFYLTTTNGDFNLYKNLIEIKALSAVPFLSPFSYSGLVAYKFKMIKSYDENGCHYYRIKITPRNLGNALLTGEVTIKDSVFVITKCWFEFPNYHTPQYNYFRVEQQYAQQQNRWLLHQQVFAYQVKTNAGKLLGNTTVSYGNYQLNKLFSKKYFSNEIGITTESAYETDSMFWKHKRADTLSKKQQLFIHFKDSVFNYTHTNQYLDSVDQANNKITFLRLAYNGLNFYNHYKEREISIGAMITMYRPVYLGGARIGNEVSINKRFKNKQFIFSNISPSYGLRNKDLKGSAFFTHMYNPFHRSSYSIDLAKDFQLININDAYINLLQRGNYYQNKKISVAHETELFNGFRISNEIEMAYRQDVSNYKLSNKFDTALKYILTNQQVKTFKPYEACYVGIDLAYTPMQKYLKDRWQKIILGSKYPTFYTNWRKGIPTVLNSKVDFDFFQFGLKQRQTLGLAGVFSYNFTMGKFFNQRNLQLVDYKFMRRGDPFLFANPIRNFQALDSTFAVLNWFYEAHIVHEFNGSVINKIPIIKKLKLLEVAGAGLLYVPERNLKYAEVFVGIEKIIRIGMDKFKIGLYTVGSTSNQTYHPIQFKIGIEKYNKLKRSW
ncbi:MAG: hypothetical protein RIQ33_1264 [Bacteroidota bacterium]|jgi:hypothetical protein